MRPTDPSTETFSQLAGLRRFTRGRPRSADDVVENLRGPKALNTLARKIAWTSAITHGLVHAAILLLPPLLTSLQHEFQVSLLAVVGVANLMQLAFGLAAVPAGRLADQFGSRTMLLMAAGGCTVSLVAIALAPSFWVLAVALISLGVSAGIYHPSGLSLLSRGVASQEQGRAIGIHGVGGNLGAALAPAWSALFAAQWGWRMGFAAAAVLSFFCWALTMTLPDVKPAPAVHRHPQASVAQLASALRTLWQSRPLRWLMICTTAGGFVYQGVLTFLPLHLADSAGGVFNASLLMSLVLVAGIVAQRFGGELADRLPRERLFLAETALFAPVMLLLGLSSGVGLIVLALSAGFLWFMAQPLSAALAAAYANSRDHGLVFGLQFAAAFGIGSFASTIGGLLVAKGGTSLAFLGFGVVAVLQLGAAGMLAFTTRRKLLLAS